MTMGNTISFYRKQKNMTQEALAQQLGVTNQAVSKWESDQCCPDLFLLPRLADLFEISMDELFGRPPKAQQEVVRTVVGRLPWNDDDTVRAVLFVGQTLVGCEKMGQPSDPLPMSKEITFVYEGEALNVESAFSVQCGDVEGDVQAGGSVNCRDVEGDIRAGGSITCGAIEGDASAGGGLSCAGSIDGDVEAGGSVSCADVGGDVHGGGTVTCGDVSGDVKTGNSITCGSIDGDASAGSNLTCKGDIGGNAVSITNLECGDIGGDVKAGGSVTCGNIEGDVSAQKVILNK